MAEYRVTFSYVDPDTNTRDSTTITVNAYSEDHARTIAGNWFRQYYRELTLK